MADLRDLPQVDKLSGSEELAEFPERVRIAAARAVIDHARALIQSGASNGSLNYAALAKKKAVEMVEQSMCPVINGSGVILHTGLGRARLAAAAESAIQAVASGHARVEFDLETGHRGDRQDHVRALLQELTGCEDALVVNNCAAAVFLSLQATCSGKEVVLSRGQMVEIGGAFRMPEIVQNSGCKLVEVGCTNKTHLSDYSNVINDCTGAILRCHPSNFKIVGFSEEPTLVELVQLAHRAGIVLIDDQGSGCLHDLTHYGLPNEPTLQDAVASGADLVLASGDKLLGGPQAGLILGSKKLIATIKKHPLARAVRIDKLTLAGLEATLRLHRDGLHEEIPVFRYMARSADSLKPIAQQFADAFSGEAVVELGVTEVGGGTTPGVGLSTYRVGLGSTDCDALAAQLRTGSPHIVARVEKDRVWLDPRTMEDDEVELVEKRLRELG